MVHNIINNHLETALSVTTFIVRALEIKQSTSSQYDYEESNIDEDCLKSTSSDQYRKTFSLIYY
jgi:hypothetical protein